MLAARVMDAARSAGGVSARSSMPVSLGFLGAVETSGER